MTFFYQHTIKQLSQGALTALLLVLSACGGSFNNPLSNLGGVNYGTSILEPTLGVTFLSPIPTVPGNKIGAEMTFTVTPALPAGLSLISATGQIVGSASVAPAPSQHTITAKFAGVEISSLIEISVQGAAAPATLTYSQTAPTYVSGTTITQNFPTTTGGVPTAYAIVQSGASPTDTLCTDTRSGPGTCLTIDPATGIISGIPSVTSLAAKNYTIRASNGAGFAEFIMSLTISSVAPPAGLSYLSTNASYPTNLLAVNAPTYDPAPAGVPQTYAIIESGGVAGNTLCADTRTGMGSCIDISATTGIISGVPSISMMNPKVYKIRASNTGGFDEVDVTINVINGVPTAFTYPTLAASYPISLPITAVDPSASDPATYTVSPGLPGGWNLNAATGQITATPSAIVTGSAHTVTKTNALGTATTAISLTVTVQAPGPLSYALNNQDYTQNVPIATNTATVTGSSLTFSSVPPLPAGLSFSAGGNIIGTPTALTAPTALNPTAARIAYTIRATNAGGYSEAVVTFSVVHAAPTGFSYADITGVPAGTPITAVNPTGMTGGAITNFTMDAGTPLPAGLLMSNATTGQITGSPTNPQASSSYTVNATNSSGVVIQTSFNIQVNNAAPNTLAYLPNIAPLSANRCGANTFRHGDNVTLTPSNAGGPIVSYAIQAGSLPAGWTFNPTTGVITSGGVISLGGPGYKVAASSPQIVIRGTNASGFTDSGPICIEVSPTAPTAVSYTNNGPTLTYTIGTAITNNTATPTAGLPNGSLAYSVTAPAANWLTTTGLTFNTTTGLMSGTPTGFGTPSGAGAGQTMTVQVSNAAMGGGSATRNFTVVIRDRAPGTFSYTFAATYSQHYPMTVSHGGHTAPANVGAISYAITGCTLPAGITVNTSTGAVSGIPTATGTVSGCAVRATATNGGLFTDSSTFGFSVVASVPDLRFVTTGQTPNPQASPTTTITPVATNVATTYSIRNAGSTTSGALTVTLNPDETTVPSTEPGFFTITPSSGCAGSCVTDGGTGTTTCTGGASIVFGGQGPAYTGTCNLIVTSNFAGIGMTSGIKRAVITATGTSGTSAAVTIQTTATYAWVAQALFETATEAAYASVGALPATCPSLGATTNVAAVDATAAGGTQARMDRNSTNDGLCTPFAPRTQYYLPQGSVRPCGDTNVANQRTVATSGGTCKNPATGDPNTIWTNYFTGTPELVDGLGPVNGSGPTAGGCDTSRKYIVQVYRCQ